MEITTLTIRRSTKERLEKLRALSENRTHSYSDLLDDLIDFISKKLKLEIN